jgi:hypothetical protein
MRTTITMHGPTLAPNDTLEYAWRSRRSRGLAPFAESSEQKVPVPLSAHWNRLAARVTAPLAIPAAGSLEEFIVEHYWGYTRARDGTTREYQVAHVPWQVAPADNVTWHCDLLDYSPPHLLHPDHSPPRLQGGAGGGVLHASLAEFLQQPPTSAIIAAGSPIQVFRGNVVGTPGTLWVVP